MRCRLAFTLLLTLPVALAAQETVSSASGTVTGHISCADTNAPARTAHVWLERFEGPRGPDQKTAFDPSHQEVAQQQVDLNGNFAFSSVVPGTYDVVVRNPGYLSLVASEDSFVQPVPPSLQPPRIIAEANQTSRVDIRLERGATVSGTVRFDDGSPAAEIQVALLYHRKKEDPRISADWIEETAGRTDDEGRYRITSLQGNDYIVRADLDRSESREAPNHPTFSFSRIRSSITIYSGDVFLLHDARHFALDSGEERIGEDITIPLSKMHSVSGVVVAANDGHVVNSGFIWISTPDGQTTIAQGELGEDGAFHFEYFPEGTFTLAVINASDKQFEDVPIPGTSYTNPEQKTVHAYGDLKQPIIVLNDITNLKLTVPEPNKKPAAAKASQ